MSMIIAVCAGVLLLGLTGSLLYAASLPLARANRKIGQERCRQLSSSFAQVLDGELRRYVTDNGDSDLAPGEEYAAKDSGTFYSYANQVMEGIYGEYDPTDPNSVLCYQSTGSGDENYGDLTVRLRKTSLEDSAGDLIRQDPFDSFSYHDRGEGTDKAEHEQFIRYQFTVEAAVELDGDNSSTSTEYCRKDSFQPLYTWNVSNYHEKPSWVESVTTGVQVYWNGSAFYTDSSFLSPIAPVTHREPVLDENGNLVDMLEWIETVDISYAYKTDEITYKRYTPVYEEHAAQEKSAPAEERGEGV